MEEARPTSTVSLVVAPALLLLAALAAYVIGYCMSAAFVLEKPGEKFRIYEKPWQATLFWPAAKVESLVSRKHVHAVYTEY